MTAHLRNRARGAPWLWSSLKGAKEDLSASHTGWLHHSFAISLVGPSYHPSPLWAFLRPQDQDVGQVRTVGTESAGTYSSVHQPRGSGHTTPAPAPSWALAGGSAASSDGARCHRTWGSLSGSSPGSPVLPSPEWPTPQGTCTQRGIGIRVLQHPTSPHPWLSASTAVPRQGRGRVSVIFLGP